MRKIYKGINYNKTIIKVLILQGSPRANGNTAWMAEEYKKAAEAAGEARGLSPVLLYSLLYLASIDDEGNISKPFLLPQENPWQFYHSSVFSYNVPDFTCDKVEFDVNGAYDEVFCDKKQQATVR